MVCHLFFNQAFLEKQKTMKCVGCNVPIGNHNNLKCNACKMHYCLSCLNVKAENTSNITAEQLASLKCPSCVNVNAAARRNRNDNSPARASAVGPTFARPASPFPTSTSINLENISDLLDQKLSSSSKIIVDLRTALNQDLKATLSLELNSIIKELKEELTKTTDFLMAEIKDLQGKVKERDNTISTLQTEQLQLREEISLLRHNYSALEKISRNRNIEIQAVPENPTENVIGLFKNLCKKTTALLAMQIYIVVDAWPKPTQPPPGLVT